MAKKHDLSDNFFPSVTRRFRCRRRRRRRRRTRNLCHAYSLDRKNYRAEILAPGVF
jgi:hypothetical protein